MTKEDATFLCHVIRELRVETSKAVASARIAETLLKEEEQDPEVVAAQKRLIEEGKRHDAPRMRFAVEAVRLMRELLEEESPNLVLFDAMYEACNEMMKGTTHG